MSDNFFTLFFASIFFLIVIAGALMFVQLESEQENIREVNRYMFSKGKAPLPRAWKSKVGKGI